MKKIYLTESELNDVVNYLVEIKLREGNVENINEFYGKAVTQGGRAAIQGLKQLGKGVGQWFGRQGKQIKQAWKSANPQTVMKVPGQTHINKLPEATKKLLNSPGYKGVIKAMGDQKTFAALRNAAQSVDPTGKLLKNLDIMSKYATPIANARSVGRWAKDTPKELINWVKLNPKIAGTIGLGALATTATAATMGGANNQQNATPNADMSQFAADHNLAMNQDGAYMDVADQQQQQRQQQRQQQLAQYRGGNKTTTSIVDYLASIGKPFDYNSRKQLATNLGIPNYRGTGDQNTQLLNMLRNQG